MHNYLTAEDSSAAFKKYLSEIAQFPLLTLEEEIMLAVKIKDGDLEARSTMIRSNLRLVVKLALSYTNLGLPLLDLIEEGNIGLMKAIDRFDPAKGAKLSTYAIWWIRQCIIRALQNQGNIIRLPLHFGEKAKRLSHISASLSEELGRPPTEDELCDETGLAVAEISCLTSALIRPRSLDAPVTDSTEMDFGDTLGDDQEQTPLAVLRNKDLRAELLAVFYVLSERERCILTARFGLEGESVKTLDQLGTVLGVTRERVRQLQNAALEKLRLAITARDVESRGGLSLAA
ncbi:MAG: RNA polymerase sigma factor RpoD/SigA [Chthoniobacterales bacterium]|nr:RNA polymerase sigma factor RpoD/SigA [Chthoniobacterales bacterium]